MTNTASAEHRIETLSRCETSKLESRAASCRWYRSLHAAARASRPTTGYWTCPPIAGVPAGSYEHTPEFRAWSDRGSWHGSIDLAGAEWRIGGGWRSRKRMTAAMVLHVDRMRTLVALFTALRRLRVPQHGQHCAVCGREDGTGAFLCAPPSDAHAETLGDAPRCPTCWPALVWVNVTTQDGELLERFAVAHSRTVPADEWEIGQRVVDELRTLLRRGRSWLAKAEMGRRGPRGS